MCGSCGCSTDPTRVANLLKAGETLELKLRTRRVQMEKEVLSKNNQLARDNRLWLDKKHVLALNIVSSPGSGKTTLLEQTIRSLQERFEIGVIEGDQETANDAERIRKTGCKAIQVNTGTGCHLDSAMIQRAMQKLDPQAHSVLFIENVGNLVCPALFDLGEHAKVVILSVTEGDDKPLKYPHMFRASQLMLINKSDLLPYVRFDVDRCIEYARKINPNIQAITVSSTRGNGMQEWYEWLHSARASLTG